MVLARRSHVVIAEMRSRPRSAMRLSRQVALTGGVRLARLAAGLAVGILTARALGPAGRGEYFVVVTLSTIIVQFGHLGLASSNSYQIARHPGLLGPLLVNSAWVSLAVAGGAAAVLTMVGVAFGLFDVEPSVLWLVIILAPASLFYLLATNLLVGLERIAEFNATEAVANLLVPGGIAVALLLGGGVAAVVGATTLCWALVACALLFALSRGMTLSWMPDIATFRRGVGYAGRAYVMTLLALLVLRANVLILQQLSGASEVGKYSIASQLGDVLLILPTSTAVVLFPRLVRAEGERGFVTVRVAVAVGAGLGILCLVAAFVANPIVHLAFGFAFAGSVTVFLALLPGVIFLGVLTVVSQYLAALGMPLQLALAWLMGLALVCALSLFLIPSLEAIGAALALSATYLAVLGAVGYLALRYRPALDL